MPVVSATKVGEGTMLVPCPCGRHSYEMTFVPGSKQIICPVLKTDVFIDMKIDRNGLPVVDSAFPIF